MQTRSKTSEAIWTAFDNMTTAPTRILKHSLQVSWKRAENVSAFAVVGTSVVNGLHIVQGLSNVLTSLDAYEYYDETDRLVSLSYDRVLQEPLGCISQALMDIELDNTDDKFTPNQNSTIGTAIIPKRPINAQIGFLIQSQNKTIPIFKGLTLQPKQDESRKLMKFTCTDLVGYLYSMPMDSELYENQRTDQIIEDILSTLGFGSSQYSLDVGLNTIPIAWFDKTQTAGERIKKLCESEEAYFYADESGILRFENRNHFAVSPHNTDIWDIDNEDIISWESDESSPIYNNITVKAKPREEQATSVVWTDSVEEYLGGTGLNAFYKFNTGALATDSSNGHTLTPISVPTEDASGKFNGAVAFAGDDAYSLADDVHFEVTTNFSISCWIKTSTTGATQMIYANYGKNPNIAGVQLYVTSANKVTFVVADNSSSSGGTHAVATTSTVTDGNWHLVIATYDGTHLKLYLDNTQEGGDVDADAPVFPANTYIRIGCYTNAGVTNTGFFIGSLDELAIWSKVLSASEMTSIFTASITTYTASINSLEIWANLSEPITEATSPVATTDYTAFTGTGGTGTNITTSQTVSIETFATAVKITIHNENTLPAYYNFLQLRGKEATVVGEITATETDTTSIDKYDKQNLVVENDFIQTHTFAETMAENLLAKYKNPSYKVNLTIQGIPQLQIKDWVRVQGLDGNITNYRVMRIQGFYQNGYFSQKLGLREITADE